MSDATRADLHSAIQAHLIDEGEGDLLTSWVVVAGSASAEDSNGGNLTYQAPEDQPGYMSIGLLESALIMKRAEVYEAVINKDV